MSAGVNNKIRKPVSFNRTKPNDMKMIKFLGRRNFSGYVKKLIQADMLEREKDGEGSSQGTEDAALPVNDANTEEISRKGVTGIDLVETSSERLIRLKKELNATEIRKPKVVHGEQGSGLAP